MAEAVLKVRNLDFEYEPDGFGLRAVSFDVNEGDLISIIGRNGSGKSTLVKMLSRIITKYNGSIKYKGEDIRSIPRKELSKNISYLPQAGYFLNEDIKVEDLLLMGRYSYKKFGDLRYSKEDKEAVDESIEQTGLGAFRSKYFHQLSGGERQKVLITLALVQLSIQNDLRGKVLMVDEPLTYLDVNFQHEIFLLLEKLNKLKGLTVLVIVHDLNLALKYTGKTILMHQGKLAYYGSSNEIITEEMLSKYFLIESKILRHNNDIFINYLPNL